MTDFTPIDKYIDDNLDDSISELSALCAQPSVAAQNLGLEETANIVAKMLAGRGFEVEIMPTGGAPVVFGERKGRTDKTLLIYNHYDVQPAEPLDLWDSPPFEPTLRDGKLYARGVSDDKGHFTYRLLAIDAIVEADGELPCNIKFVVEGEEEVGSVHLPDFVADNVDKLAADACVWEFGEVDERGVPIQYLGLRGICYVELSVKTADVDIHSGLGGSISHNAAWRLIWALGTLKTRDEVIQIPNHYDTVEPPSERDLELLSALPDGREAYKERFGVDSFLREYDDKVDWRVEESFVPTCTICGLTSGYQGPGSKTIVPAEASAKVDFRLAIGQTVEDVLQGLRAHLDAAGFEDVEITFLGGGPGARTDPDDPFVKLVTSTAKDVYGHEMEIVPMIGGSGPNSAFIQHLKVPVVTAGFGDSGANVHAPNENLRLDLYLQAAKHMARIIQAFGE